MIKIISYLSFTLFFILVSLNVSASKEINENLLSYEMKISSLSEEVSDLSSRQRELDKAITESWALQNEINSTASNLVSFIEGKHLANKPISVEIIKPVNWYPYLIPLITIIIVIVSAVVSIRTITVKSNESLSALKDSNKTLVDINNTSMLEEQKRSQKTIITNNRQEWINSLRNEITSFLAVIASTSPSQDSSDIPDSDMKSLWLHSYKIQLLLNPNEKDHEQLINKIRTEIDNLHKNNEDTLISEIISLSQEILKREWVRVKNFEKNS